MQCDTFCSSRPLLYHLTARSNLARIRRTGRLQSAEQLFGEAGLRARNFEKRSELEAIVVGADNIVIRDQAPLHVGNIDLNGRAFADIVAMLNKFVYFWPGSESGPIRSGRNHFGRYAMQDCVVLVLPSKELYLKAAGRLCLSRCNSGAPRMNNGRRQPRDAGTFVSIDAFPSPPSDVVEVVVPDFVDLPEFVIRDLSSFPLQDWAKAK